MLSLVYRIFQEGEELWQRESSGEIAVKLGIGGEIGWPVKGKALPASREQCWEATKALKKASPLETPKIMKPFGQGQK